MSPDTATDTKKKLTKKQEAELRTLRDGVQRLPDNWIACRDMRHAWQVLMDFHVSEENEGLAEIRRDLVCLRCSTVRRESYENNRYGLDKVSTSYVYPQDYQLHGLPQGINLQSLVRQDQYRRAMEKVVSTRKGA